MRRGLTERETCDLNGWGIGTRLIGDEGYGPAIIEITHFTRNGSMLAICESRQGERVEESEHFWTLECREWSEVQ